MATEGRSLPEYRARRSVGMQRTPAPWRENPSFSSRQKMWRVGCRGLPRGGLAIRSQCGLLNGDSPADVLFSVDVTICVKRGRTRASAAQELVAAMFLHLN